MTAARELQELERLVGTPEAIAKLRRFVLSLAVSGRLVAQRETDDSAESLVEQASRGQLKVPLPARYQRLVNSPIDPAPFPVPSSWTWTRLGRVADYLQRGKSPTYSATDGPLVVSQKCVRWEGLDLGPARSITPESLAGYDIVRFIRDGDLLWNSTGTGTIGRVSLVVDPASQLVCDSHVTIVRCSQLNPEYLQCWLRSDYVFGSIEDVASGSTNQVELTLQMALGQPVPLPPRQEQDRIVARVADLMTFCDDLVIADAAREFTRDRLRLASFNGLISADESNQRESTEFALSNLERVISDQGHVAELRKTIIDLAVQGRLVTQETADGSAEDLVKEFSEQRAIAPPRRRSTRSVTTRAHVPPFAIPPSWAWTELSDICSVNDGDHQPPPQVDEGVPFLVIGNVLKTPMELDECRRVPVDYYMALSDSRRPRHGDILYTLVGATLGRPVLVDHNKQFCVQRHVGILRPVEGMPSSFLMLVLKSGFAFNRAHAIATGTGQKTVPLLGLRRLPIPLPPLAEQVRIVARVDELMAVCDELEAALANAQSSRSNALEALMRDVLSDGVESDEVNAG